MRQTFFISDLHLSDHTPHLLNLFTHFMENLAPSGDALYILGDLFDFWVGDDENSAVVAQVCQQIQQLSAKGVPCYFIAGNRDFLIGKAFAQRANLTLLPDYALIDLYGTPTLLCHGDTLCLEDESYQKFRHYVHKKWLQRLFLALPLRLRLRLAHKVRNQSQAAKGQKATHIMDVTPSFVEHCMQQHHAQRLIHGHTHRQNTHQHPTGTRIVLGDWGEKWSVLSVRENGTYEFLQAK